MAERKTPQERIDELERKEKQLKARREALIARQREADRKARTKRLIEAGATAESAIGKPIEKADLPQFQATLRAAAELERQIGKPLSEVDPAQLSALIHSGAVIAEVLKRPITPADPAALRAYLENQELRGCYFSRAMNGSQSPAPGGAGGGVGGV